MKFCQRLLLFCNLCAILLGSWNLKNSRELDLETPFTVFSDVEDLGRLPSLKVSLISLVSVHFKDPHVDLLPPEASLSHSFAAHMFTDVDAMFFIMRHHDDHLLWSRFASDSF